MRLPALKACLWGLVMWNNTTDSSIWTRTSFPSFIVAIWINVKSSNYSLLPLSLAHTILQSSSASSTSRNFISLVSQGRHFQHPSDFDWSIIDFRLEIVAIWINIKSSNYSLFPHWLINNWFSVRSCGCLNWYKVFELFSFHSLPRTHNFYHRKFSEMLSIYFLFTHAT